MQKGRGGTFSSTKKSLGRKNITFSTAKKESKEKNIAFHCKKEFEGKKYNLFLHKSDLKGVNKGYISFSIVNEREYKVSGIML